MSNFSYRTIGKIGEAKALTKFAEYGVIGYIPFNEDSRSDLIVDVKGKLLRVQVKTSSRYDNGKIVFETEQSGTYENDVDYFVFYNLLHDELYMMDINIVKDSKTITLRREECKVDLPTCRYAIDYDMDYILEEVLNLDKISKELSSKLCISKDKHPPSIRKSKCPTREDMVELLTKYKALQPIADLFEISIRSVGRWCRQLDIDYHEYTDKKLTEKICPVCGNTFKTKNNGQIYCSQECVNHRSLVKVNKEEAKHLYYDEHWSARRIASKYGVTHGLIDKLVKHWEQSI